MLFQFEKHVISVKVSICGKTSLSSNAQSSKMKAKIWELRNTILDMIAAATTVVSYLL